ncbi:MAG: hypothetical protein VX346_28960 [Planctomycetota bacterium]|nr:hypothetical protein [Planctomycetota bacterium]
MRRIQPLLPMTWMVCFLAASPLGICSSPNLVRNGSFEEDQDTDGLPDGWVHGAGHYGRWQEKVKKQLGKGALVEDRAAQGRRSIRIAVPKNNAGKYWNQGWEGMSFRQKVPTQPMTTYTMSMKVFNQDTSGMGDYAFLYAMAGVLRGSEAFATIRFEDAPSGKWVERKVVFQTGRETTYTMLSIETRWNIGTLYIDEICLQEGGRLELSPWDQAVPVERLLPVQHRFARPNDSAVRVRFQQHHTASEARYRGAGQWESKATLAGRPGGEKQPPDLRATYQRVEGYLGAYQADGRPIYLQRAREGADYLLQVQQENGTIGDPYYGSGQAGVALVHAWQQTGNTAYRAAATRIVDHFQQVEVSWNYNYNMMLTEAALAWAQATDGYHRVADRLQSEMLQSTLREQRPWGGWAGHNSRIGYHCANLSAFCQLFQSLPPEPQYDPLRGKLKQRVTAALNRMIRAQVPTGGFPFVHGQPGTARQNSGIVPALIQVHETFGWEEACHLLYGQMTYLGTDACGEYYWLPKNRNHLEMSLLHSEGLFLSWSQRHPD